MTAPLLIFGYGNPSRGDDALGPVLIERIESLNARHPRRGDFDLLTDYQLQVEHALDLLGRRRVIFVDASTDAPAPFGVERLAASDAIAHTTHAMSPSAVLAVYRKLCNTEPPPCEMLAIRGYRFGLGESLSEQAVRNLDAAHAWIIAQLDEPA